MASATKSAWKNPSYLQSSFGIFMFFCSWGIWWSFFSRWLTDPAHGLGMTSAEQGQIAVRRSQAFGRSLAQGRADPGVCVLHIEHRIFLRRLDHLVEIEVHLRFGLAGQHGKTDNVPSDHVDHIGQRHEIARAL